MNSNETATSAASLAKVGPRDVFLQLLAVVALYASAISFGALLFQFTNLALPDPLTDMYERSRDPIRWAVSALVVVFPVYAGVMFFLRKDETAHPEKRELKIRKWLLYFTLFAAAVVIFGDIIALVYNFLRGELTARFLLKIASIFFIAATIFGYYLWNLKMEVMASRDPRMRWFVYGMAAVIAAAIVGGFVTAGSPFEERARRFDERRVQNLQEIHWQIISYWQRKEVLPAKLDDLRDPISGFVPPRDPETGAEYEYRASGALAFELCASFDTPSTAGPMIGPRLVGSEFDATYNWMHESGRACFERTIDPEFYPPFEKSKR